MWDRKVYIVDGDREVQEASDRWVRLWNGEEGVMRSGSSGGGVNGLAMAGFIAWDFGGGGRLGNSVILVNPKSSSLSPFP